MFNLKNGIIFSTFLTFCSEKRFHSIQNPHRMTEIGCYRSLSGLFATFVSDILVGSSPQTFCPFCSTCQQICLLIRAARLALGFFWFLVGSFALTAGSLHNYKAQMYWNWETATATEAQSTNTRACTTFWVWSGDTKCCIIETAVAETKVRAAVTINSEVHPPSGNRFSDLKLAK